MGQSLNLWSAPSLICERLLPRHPTPTLAAVLLQYLDIGHDHAAVDGLAHVVDGEQGDLGDIQINNLGHTISHL